MGCKLKEYELGALSSAAAARMLSSTGSTIRWTSARRPTSSGRPIKASISEYADSPRELEDAIRAKAADGASARMTAGYCWDWSKPKEDGTLVDDVVIGSYARPWNARPEAARLARGIPGRLSGAWSLEESIKSACIYTAQGFEFDYVGVIFGKDLVYNPDRAAWTGIPTESSDKVFAEP